MKLNLQTKNKGEERIKEYLENNANEHLAQKINKGTPFTKDGKPFINKKTLSGFMNYANKQAREQAEKGANCAYVEDDVVYGWAMHYFEEDSIEEKLYNPDGTEYVPPKPKYIPKPSTPVIETKPQPKVQQSLFDILQPQEEKPKNNPYEIAKQIKEKYENLPDDEPSAEDITEAFDSLDDEVFGDQPKPQEKPKPQGSPVYQRYMHVQSLYPNSVVVYRLGDFYEVFGESAIKIADILDLTLTSRDFGLEERIPMVGFPYHIADEYISKILDNEHTVAKVENLDNIKLLQPQPKEKYWLNDNTFADSDGVVHEENTPSSNDAVIAIWKNILGDELQV